MKTIPIEYEIILGFSMFFQFIRLYFQSIESRKAGKSVNGVHYWFLTLISAGLFGIYGLLIGSFLIPIATIFTLTYSYFHYHLDKYGRFPINILNQKKRGD